MLLTGSATASLRGVATASAAATASLGVLLGVALLAGCSSGRPASAPTTTVAPTTSTSASTVPVTSPPTTIYSPSSPQSSPDAAAARLVGAWSRRDRGEAATVATPVAVQALFSVAYPSGYLQDRGCTDASTNPGTCTYRNTSSNAIYEITVQHASSGWYVTAVTVES